MAKDLKIGQSTLSGWENGTRTPNLDMIVKIGKYLNIYEDYITKDLTIKKEKCEIQKLLDDNIDKLTDSNKTIIKTIIEERIKE